MLAYQADAPSSARKLVTRIEPEGWGGALPQDIQKVIESAGSEILKYVVPNKPILIHVVPSDKVPQVDFKRAANGEYTVRLSAKGRFWAQFAFQFGHELAHIVAHYERGNDNKLGNENKNALITEQTIALMHELKRLRNVLNHKNSYMLIIAIKSVLMR